MPQIEHVVRSGPLGLRMTSHTAPDGAQGQAFDSYGNPIGACNRNPIHLHAEKNMGIKDRTIFVEHASVAWCRTAQYYAVKRTQGPGLAPAGVMGLKEREGGLLCFIQVLGNQLTPFAQEQGPNRHMQLILMTIRFLLHKDKWVNIEQRCQRVPDFVRKYRETADGLLKLVNSLADTILAYRPPAHIWPAV